MIQISPVDHFGEFVYGIALSDGKEDWFPVASLQAASRENEIQESFSVELLQEMREEEGSWSDWIKRFDPEPAASALDALLDARLLANEAVAQDTAGKYTEAMIGYTRVVSTIMTARRDKSTTAQQQAKLSLLVRSDHIL